MNRAQRRYLDATLRPGARGRIHTSPTSWARDDRQWFKRRPDRSHRVRDRFPGEEFGSRDDPTLDMVAVRKIAAGVRVDRRSRSQTSPCAEHVREATATEHGASIMFELAKRGEGPIRCDVIVALSRTAEEPPSGSVQ